jgi:ATP phosphoribosyltransferase
MRSILPAAAPTRPPSPRTRPRRLSPFRSAMISLMLRLVLPKGSLERATLQLFEDADLGVSRASDVAYRASVDDPRIDDVRILRPQEIPAYVAEGLFDLGITGRDCIEERGSDVVSLGELSYSKATNKPSRVVLAVASDSPVTSLAELAALPGRLRISSEYPELTRKVLAGHGIEADISFSYGATEAKVPEIADAVVDMTETGSALRAAGLRIIETLLVSHTELIANRASAADPTKRHAMEQIFTLLQGTLEARGKVLVKLNVSAEQLDSVLSVLPSMRSPTISELSGGGAFAVEAVVAKSDINILIPALCDHGATDILEIPLSKIVH